MLAGSSLTVSCGNTTLIVLTRPAAGKVLERKNIRGHCYADTVVREGIDRKVLALSGATGFRFAQTRG